MSLAENYFKAGISLLGVCLLLSGCVSRKEIVRFQEQLDYLEESNHHLEKDVASLDSLLKAQKTSLFQIQECTCALQIR